MNNEAKQYFSRVAIENVFREDPTYLCDHLFGGDWVKMYEYITNNLSDSISSYFPGPAWTEVAPDWTDDDYKKNRISMCTKWDVYRMGYSLKQAFDEGCYVVRNALENGLTMEDLK